MDDRRYTYNNCDLAGIHTRESRRGWAACLVQMLGYHYPIAAPNKTDIAVSVVKAISMFDDVKIDMKSFVY
jgi:hypothetical protein